MSNLYEIENGNLTLSHLRSFPTTPLVKLGSSFDKVSHFFDTVSITFIKHMVVFGMQLVLRLMLFGVTFLKC